ncbi:RNA polymerase sigma factor [Mucilaginibacter sp. UR6-11]|uniref:RNA polymerase sigma factor n=1 Tax=Mucilaginibacter sp. UR6-11 TaxID=1435644 RepID=UPI001E4A9D16|nr:sigma-70 family RNA polymerase sigma factor [Mucilaginibacter sp. UR6-11]MCC8426459.1 sigma-70 family RNA polymerase sigma factor [Mucilaginibacter sp. UR6-11]
MNLSKSQTEKLVKGCINNTRTVQEALYKLFYADMLRVCCSYLPDKELAKEALNTGFLKVFKSIENFDIEKGELGGWIRKIMIFTTIDLCRKELKFSSLTLDEQDQDDFFISPSVLEKLYFEDILSHVRLLPYATQTVFGLYVLDGYTHKEIAGQLNISEGTSRWHLAEARRKLRAQFEPPAKKDQATERSDKAK